MSSRKKFLILTLAIIATIILANADTTILPIWDWLKTNITGKVMLIAVIILMKIAAVLAKFGMEIDAWLEKRASGD